MRPGLEAMLAESGFGQQEADELRSVLAPLGETGSSVPEPSPELAVLLGEDATREEGGPRLASRTGIGRRAGAGALVLALSGVTATGLSAAANTLPGPLQHEVSQFSREHLPFVFPEPEEGAKRERLVRDDAVDVPGQDSAGEPRRTRGAAPGSPRTPSRPAAPPGPARTAGPSVDEPPARIPGPSHGPGHAQPGQSGGETRGGQDAPPGRAESRGAKEKPDKGTTGKGTPGKALGNEARGRNGSPAKKTAGKGIDPGERGKKA